MREVNMPDKSYTMRSLNPSGIEKIKKIHKQISNSVNDNEYKKILLEIDNILFDDSYSKEYLINGEKIYLQRLNFLKPFPKVYSFIKYLKKQISNEKNNEQIPVLTENGVYTWITFFYLDLQVKKTNNLNTLSHESHRYILDSENSSSKWKTDSYRHIIFSLLNLSFIHPNAKVAFAKTNNLSYMAWSDTMENTFARSGFVVKHPQIIELLDKLYVDENSSDLQKDLILLKEGYGRKPEEGFGGVLRRLIKGSGDIRSQLEIKWAINELTVDELFDLLPDDEFGKDTFLKEREELKEPPTGTVATQGIFPGF
tara:strand:+ start:740 stop:1675 length:936 start_codon:yes stop_codon:yes gene_type:complete